MHGVDVVHPVLVHNAEKYHALKLAHNGGFGVRHKSKLTLALGVDRLRALFEGVGYLGVACAGNLIRRGEEQPEKRLCRLGFIHNAVDMRVAHCGVDDVGYHGVDARANVLAVEHSSALGVDDLALSVHNVVVL